MMDEEIVDPAYKAGFNEGYILQRGDDKIAEDFLRRRREHPHVYSSPKDKGMADGIFQARIETMHRDLDDVFNKKKKRGLKH